MKTKPKEKIKSLKELSLHIETLKQQGLKVVHCHGVFDLLHVGHIKHFNEAKTFGDILVVTLTPDQYVNKGPHRPAFTQELRTEFLSELDCIDFVSINEWPSAVETIQLLKPNIYVKGPDYKNFDKDISGGIIEEQKAIESVAGELKFTEDITFSSSNLLNRFFPTFSAELSRFLEEFRKNHSSEQIISQIESLKDLKVLVIGEAILDEYVYCEALGKSSKEPIIAMKYLSQDIHAGGSLAIANHIASFTKEVSVLSFLGDYNSHESFIRSKLKENVRGIFFSKKSSPTVLKRRFLDAYLLTKTFEIYEINDEPLCEEDEAVCHDLIQKEIKNYDVIIVSDFGHGMLSEKNIQFISEQSKFLAVNTQVNAANIGYHTISRYPRADYISIHEGEVRQDQRNRQGDIHPLIENLESRTKASHVMITRGKKGSLIHKRNVGFFECPAFADKVVDRIGSGDAVLAISSLCVAKQIEPDVIGFVSNLIGAQAVKIVGNSSSVDKTQLLKSIESLLK